MGNFKLYFLVLLFSMSCKQEIKTIDFIKRIEKMEFPLEINKDNLETLYQEVKVNEISEQEQLSNLLTVDIIDDKDVNEVYQISYFVAENNILVAAYLTVNSLTHPYYDNLLVVTHKPNGELSDILKIKIQDEFTWNDITIPDAVNIEVRYFDDEYSPDPESEEEHIENDVNFEVSGKSSFYQINEVGQILKNER